MPTYEYSCKKCKHEFEELVFDNEKIKCPKCGSVRLNKLFSAPNLILNSLDSAKTFGQCAAINSKRLGKEQLKIQESTDPVTIMKEQNSKLPWWRSGKVDGLPKEEKPLDTTKIKDVTKYIETGEKE